MEDRSIWPKDSWTRVAVYSAIYVPVAVVVALIGLFALAEGAPFAAVLLFQVIGFTVVVALGTAIFVGLCGLFFSRERGWMAIALLAGLFEAAALAGLMSAPRSLIG